MQLGREGSDVLVVTGEVDLATAPQLGAELADPTITCVDLSRVEFADAALARALLMAEQQPGRGILVLRAPSRAVRRLLALCGLADRFAIDGGQQATSSPPLT